MALDAGTVWEFRADASNDNGGGYFDRGGSSTDYTLQSAAALTLTDLAMTTGGTTLTSVTGGFTAAMAGNVIYIKSGTNFTAGWYEITAHTDTNTVTLDRDATSGSNGSAGTGSVGGARAVPTDAFGEQLEPGNVVWFEAGTYTLTEAVNVAKDGTEALPITWAGYNATRGDTPTGDSRPLWVVGNMGFRVDAYTYVSGLRVIDTAPALLQVGNGSKVNNCYTDNTSGLSRVGIYATTATVRDSWARSVNGFAFRLGGVSALLGSVAQGSATGVYIGIYQTSVRVSDCLVTGCDICVDLPTTGGYRYQIDNNTFYGAATPAGSGIDMRTSTRVEMTGNIFQGFATAVQADSLLGSHILDYNCYFNNTADVSSVTKGPHAVNADPLFTDAAGGDFSLASGSPCIGAGFPGTFPGGNTTGYMSIGAVQPEAGDGSVVLPPFVCPGVM